MSEPDPINGGGATECPPAPPAGTPSVLQVLPALETGGVERGTVDIARALVEAGGRAVVASAGGVMVHEIERAGARHVVLPLDAKGPLAIRANIERLRALIEAEGVDLVHARSRAPAWSALYAARRTGTPLVTTFHGTYSFGNPLKRLYNAVMTRGDRVIAISEFIAGHIRANYPIDEARLRIVPRGIDFALFDPARVSAQRLVVLSRRWRLGDEMQVVMLPGRLTRWKGHRVLIDALAELGRHDLRCLLVGSDQGRAGYRRELEEQARRRGVDDVVQIVDDCRDMPAPYMLADAAASAPLDPGAFARVAGEAPALRRPTDPAHHGGARETVAAGETGWLVPPGDARALAAALEHALALDRTAREQLAERAIARARARFSREAMCARTLAIYRELAPAPADAHRAHAAQ